LVIGVFRKEWLRHKTSVLQVVCGVLIGGVQNFSFAELFVLFVAFYLMECNAKLKLCTPIERSVL